MRTQKIVYLLATGWILIPAGNIYHLVPPLILDRTRIVRPSQVEALIKDSACFRGANGEIFLVARPSKGM